MAIMLEDAAAELRDSPRAARAGAAALSEVRILLAERPAVKVQQEC